MSLTSGLRIGEKARAAIVEYLGDPTTKRWAAIEHAEIVAAAGASYRLNGAVTAASWLLPRQFRWPRPDADGNFEIPSAIEVARGLRWAAAVRAAGPQPEPRKPSVI